MSYSMINIKILRKFGEELAHVIKPRFVETCSTEDYINVMQVIITTTKIGKTWTKKSMESKILPKTSKEDRTPEIPVYKCQTCGSNSHSSNTFTKKTRINKAEVIEEVWCSEGKKNLTNIWQYLITHQQRIILFKKLQLSFNSMNFILTCHNIVKIATTPSISRSPYCAGLNLLVVKAILLENPD
ncbi:hypothetical protein O181_039400 [Austropuccinia psidii MF-1]|uniref:Uncharacterized protein n=1 Tax=Austropuccinia psidii MF-1 TaxID=1389203 RepID=A0A9Q3DEV1_9BASI|nr:hypothetical protein [Austropuccinia psidii MF-1]